MKAMVLEAVAPIDSSPLKPRDLPLPEPGPGEVRIKVRCCAICRTDLHVIEGELPQQKLPIIPGHQVVGSVDKVGEGCSGFREGERAGVAWLRHTCGRCIFCNRGQENLCESSRYTGYYADGGYAEYVVAPESFVYRIPNAFDDADAAPLLCAGIIGYRALKRAQVKASFDPFLGKSEATIMSLISQDLCTREEKVLWTNWNLVFAEAETRTKATTADDGSVVDFWQMDRAKQQGIIDGIVDEIIEGIEEQQDAAAERMGLTPEETDAYAKAVVQADFEEAGDEDVIRKLAGDLTAAQVEISDAEIRAALNDKAVEARRQFMDKQG